MYRTALRTLLSFVTLTLCVAFIHAQTNGSMETWSTNPADPPFNWMFPTGWTTNNAAVEFNGACVRRTNDKKAGTYAAQLTTSNVFGVMYRAQLILGDAAVKYQTYSVVGNTGGEALAMVPQQISFWYKMVSDSAENAVFDVLIKRAGDPDIDTVFYGTTELEPSAIYTQVDVLIPDVAIQPSSDSIVLLFSSNDTSELGRNTLFVDEISIDFVSASTAIQKEAKLYPNLIPSGGSIRIESTDPVHHVRIIEMSGAELVDCYHLATEGEHTVLSDISIPPGVYVILVNGMTYSRFVVMG